MAIRNLAIPWLSGGALLLGYAAFGWLRAKRPKAMRTPLPKPEQDAKTEPRPRTGENGPDALVLDFEALDVGGRSEPPQSRVQTPRSALGGLFLARATEALSPREFDGFSSVGAQRRSSAR